MKRFSLNKDQTQKLVLSTIGFVALIYCYFTFFLGPLNKSRTAMTNTIADLQKKIDSSKTEMKKTSNLEQQATAATSRYAALKGTIAEGAPIAWFPPRMKAFFANQNIDRASTRIDTTAAYKQPELADFMRYNWAIDLPLTDFSAVGRALAALEEAEPLLAVTKLQIHVTADNPQFQMVTFSAATTLLKK